MRVVPWKQSQPPNPKEVGDHLRQLGKAVYGFAPANAAVEDHECLIEDTLWVVTGPLVVETADGTATLNSGDQVVIGGPCEYQVTGQGFGNFYLVGQTVKEEVKPA